MRRYALVCDATLITSDETAAALQSAGIDLTRKESCMHGFCCSYSMVIQKLCSMGFELVSRNPDKKEFILCKKI